MITDFVPAGEKLPERGPSGNHYYYSEPGAGLIRSSAERDWTRSVSRGTFKMRRRVSDTGALV